MKKLFLLNGMVVGHATSFDGDANVSCAVSEAFPHVVADDSPVSDGWTYTEVDGVFEFFAPIVITKENTKVTPVEFKLLFTGPERVAIKKSADPLVQDFFELVENQRIVNAADANRGTIDLGLKSTIGALTYLETINLIDAGRAAQILSGAHQ